MNIKPFESVRILTVEIAVKNDIDVDTIADEISALLTEHGIFNPNSAIVDWRYKITLQNSKVVNTGANPEEGSIFTA